MLGLSCFCSMHLMRISKPGPKMPLKQCFLFSICLMAAQSSVAQVTEVHGQTASGAYYTIALPENWQPQNGLVIWNHGYQGYTTRELDSDPSLGPLDDIVLAQGYAMAASSYSQTGWAVFNSHIDNQQLFERFVEVAGQPEKVFIQGASLGGIISVRDLEEGLIPDIDGALLMCGAVAGSDNWVEAFDLRMVYEAVCSEASNAELPTDFWAEQPKLITGEVEFLESLERCTGLVLSTLIDDPLGQLLQSHAQAERLNRILELTNTDVDFLLLDLGYAVFEIPSLVNDASKLDGLLPFGNAGIDYGDENINNVIQRSVALPSATQLFRENYTPVGDIGNSKVVSIHTSKDGLVKVENQLVLQSLLPPSQLTSAIVVEETASHCEFSEEEGLSAWNKLIDWSAGGAQPGVLDLQQACLASTQNTGQCRFEADFEFRESLLSFPRNGLAATSGLANFDGDQRLLSIESLYVAGDESNFNVELHQSPEDDAFFTLGMVEGIPQPELWQPRPLYSPLDSLLYLPGLRVLPYLETDSQYNVFMQYINDGEREGLELLEFEIVN